MNWNVHPLVKKTIKNIFTKTWRKQQTVVLHIYNNVKILQQI